MTSRIVFDRVLPATRIAVSDREPARATVWLSGEVDAECAQALRRELICQQMAARRLVRIDLNAVTMLDGTALGVLVDAHHVWLRMRGTLVLLGVAGPALRVFRLTGMDRELFHMPPSADAALGRELVGLAG